MLTTGLNGLASVHLALSSLLEIVSRNALGMLGTMLELVVFCALVWALLGSRANPGRTQRDRNAQRLRARQKELTLK
jgi:hypothetical protein